MVRKDKDQKGTNRADFWLYENHGSPFSSNEGASLTKRLLAEGGEPNSCGILRRSVPMGLTNFEEWDICRVCYCSQHVTWNSCLLSQNTHFDEVLRWYDDD